MVSGSAAFMDKAIIISCTAHLLLFFLLGLWEGAGIVPRKVEPIRIFFQAPGVHEPSGQNTSSEKKKGVKTPVKAPNPAQVSESSQSSKPPGASLSQQSARTPRVLKSSQVPKPVQGKKAASLPEGEGYQKTASREKKTSETKAVFEQAALQTEEIVKPVEKGGENNRPSASMVQASDSAQEMDTLLPQAPAAFSEEGEGGAEPPQDDGLFDLDWQGQALQSRYIPEALFQLPRGSYFFDVITVRFSVEPSGTVSSVRVLPPGSGHPQVDRQIRAYVLSFLFEEFSKNEAVRDGRLYLHLKAMDRRGL